MSENLLHRSISSNCAKTAEARNKIVSANIMSSEAILCSIDEETKFYTILVQPRLILNKLWIDSTPKQLVENCIPSWSRCLQLNCWVESSLAKTPGRKIDFRRRPQ